MKTYNKNNMGMGFIPQEKRVVDGLYQPGNVLIPLNSGDSLYMAAQKIRELGVGVYMAAQKIRELGVDVYMAAQKIRELGVDIYMDDQKIKELGVDVYMDNLRKSKKLQKLDSEIDEQYMNG